MRRFCQAQQLFRETLAHPKAAGDRWNRAYALSLPGATVHVEGRYPEPERLLQQGIAINEIRVPSVWITALMSLTKTMCVPVEYDQPRACFCQALKRSMQAGCRNRVPEALVGLADLLVREGKDEQGAGLLALILHHPASPHAVRERAERLLAEVAADLPPEVIAAAAKARGDAQELTDVVENILHSNTWKGSTYAH